jgi:hypothetical protein
MLLALFSHNGSAAHNLPHLQQQYVWVAVLCYQDDSIYRSPHSLCIIPAAECSSAGDEQQQANRKQMLWHYGAMLICSNTAAEQGVMCTTYARV